MHYLNEGICVVVMFIFAFLTSIACYLISRVFNKTQNGKLRFFMMWIFRVLSLALLIKASFIVWPMDYQLAYGSTVGMIVIGFICLAMWAFYFYLRKKYLLKK